MALAGAAGGRCICDAACCGEAMIPEGNRDVSSQAAQYFQIVADQYRSEADQVENLHGPEDERVKELRSLQKMNASKAAAIRAGDEVLSVEESVTDDKLPAMFAKQLV